MPRLIRAFVALLLLGWVCAAMSRDYPELADLVERQAPAVVNINTTAMIDQPTGPAFPEGSPFSDLFRDFGIPGVPGIPGGPDQGSPFGNRGPMQQERSNALGSGGGVGLSIVTGTPSPRQAATSTRSKSVRRIGSSS